VGHDCHVIGNGNSSNHHIHRPNDLACSLKRVSNQSIGFSRSIVELQRSMATEKHMQSSKSPLRIAIAMGAKQKFSLHNRAKHNRIRPNATKASNE